MNGSTLLALALTGWLAQTTPPAAPAAPAAAAQDKPVSASLKVRIGTSTYLADGRVLNAAASDWTLKLNQPVVAYATSGRSLCDSRAAALETPADAGYGWRVTVTPIRDTATELEVRVAWRRMWEGGPRTLAGADGTAVLTLHPGDRLIVDYLNAGSRQSFNKLFQRIDVKGGTAAAGAAGTSVEFKRLQDRLPLVARKADAGCSAIGMGLEIGLDTARTQPVVEAELWLVRPNRDGTEQSERQAVKLPVGQPPSSYAFDEQTLVPATPAAYARLIPAAKVTGAVSLVSVEGGKIHLNFSVSRQYDLGPGFAERPGNERTTNATYRDLVATPGEVLAFQLPTIEIPVIQTNLLGGGQAAQTVTYRALPQLSVRLRAQVVR